jgi:hypothetical protein
MTDTAAGNRRIASLKEARSSSGAVGMTSSFPHVYYFRGQYLHLQMNVNAKFANANFCFDAVIGIDYCRNAIFAARQVSTNCTD